MGEAPDKRVWFIFVPVLVVAMAYFLVPPESLASRIVEPVLYFLCVVLGLGIGALSIRDGYSLLRPSLTSTDSPVMFWIDAATCLLFAAVGAWKLFKMVTGAV
jgi:hypothetical protein